MRHVQMLNISEGRSTRQGWGAEAWAGEMIKLAWQAHRSGEEAGLSAESLEVTLSAGLLEACHSESLNQSQRNLEMNHPANELADAIYSLHQ